MPERVPRFAKIWAGWTQKLPRKFAVFDVSQHTKRHKVRILASAKAAPAHSTHQGGCHVICEFIR